MEIQEIKQRLSIQIVLKNYGLSPDRNGLLKCPFHPDKTPSMKIYPETNTFYCFACGTSGDTIQLIELYEKCSKHEAILKAASLISNVQLTMSNAQNPTCHTEPVEVANTQNLIPVAERVAILTKIFESFRNGLLHPISVKPKEYLKKRNLNLELLEAGYNSGQFHHRGKLSEADRKACIAVGLLIPYKGSTPNDNGQGYTPFAKDCIIFPLRDKQGRIVSLYGRSINADVNGTGKHFYLKDRQGLYPHYPNAETEILILTEAIIDAATLLQCCTDARHCVSQNTSILACYGTNGLTDEHRQSISELKELHEIIFFFDGDEAGRKAAEKYASELSTGGWLSVSIVETPEGEDINSLSIGHTPEIFTHLLENRKQFFAPANQQKKSPSISFLLNEPSLIENESPVQTQGIASPQSIASAQSKPSQPGKLNTRNPEFITFTTDELQIILLGGINLQQLDRLRVTMKISRCTDARHCVSPEHSFSANPLHSIRHTLDLYHSDYLEKFIDKASEQLEIGTNTIRRAIAELTEQIEAYRISKIESLKERKPKLRELSPERSRRAINYLSAPELMKRTNEDIGKTGVIGEENNRLLMFSVFTSRLREQPLHIISLGASGTGKTYLQEKISELIPENDKLEITILSENAFYYFDKKELKHKLVLIEDMDGAENVLYPLRELQTKRHISKTVPIKDSKGNLKTITLHVEGPISLAGTTTKERLYEDNANRSLLIYLDNSPEHREQIMEYQRRLSAGKIDTKAETELKEFFKDIQSVLKPVKVRNPYAESLKLPEYVFKPLRTNAHYLATIETITFYHQYQRELKSCTDVPCGTSQGEPYIETTLEDIEWANRILKDVLLAKADELPNVVREFFEKLKNWLKANGRETFYAKETREIFRMASSSCNRYILELLRYNYIKITGGDKHRKGYEYQVIKPDEYVQLQEHVRTALDEALENIKKSVSRIPTVSQNKNGILNQNATSNLKAVSRYPTETQGRGIKKAS